MKRLFVIIMILIAANAIAQLNPGVYRSTPDSFKKDYYLIVEKDEITLLGWVENGIYFKATIPNLNEDRLTFGNFKYSYTDIGYKHFREFKNDPVIKYFDAGINRYFFQFKKYKEGFSCISAKDFYNNRADDFRFEKIE